MKNIIILLCLLTILISCKEKSSGMIEIDSNQNSGNFDLANFYSSTDYVGLTFPDSVNLTSIRSSKIKNDKLYVHDLPQNKILVFDLNTESFLYTIQEIGEGPEEYQLINDFDVDENDILYIYDFGRKIIAFKDGQFYKEWHQLKLHIRGFQKTKNGFLLISPNEGYEQNRYPIVEIDQEGNVLNLMGGEMAERLSLPIKFFQKESNSIYINDMYNNQIVTFDIETDSIEYSKFFIKDSSTFQIVDFWQINFEDYFLMIAFQKGEEEQGIISYFKENKFVSNYTSFLCSLDLLAMSSFPTNDDKGEYDYSLMTDEFFPSFEDYLKNITVEMGGSLELDGDYYSFKEYKLEKNKFEANRTKILGILSNNKILMRKYIRR
ncbi:6-bladed beta-propeller [Algoriphagus sp.]|uniref:6-bladed beta-propeller n=1 Tax=Algoriphagus sp. TaxID=1872435 RepID=UPI00326C89BF